MRRLWIAILGAALAACGSSGETNAPEVEAPFLLRATIDQAIAPEFRFATLPTAFVTSDLRVITLGAIPASFPGPLVASLFAAPITPAGYQRIVDRAGQLGLLDGDGNFAPDPAPPGAQTGRIELLVDGTMRELRGDPNRIIQCIQAPCNPAPGTPEAFGTFWTELYDLRSLVGREIGQDQPFDPDGYALLIGVEPPDPAGLQVNILPWPLETPLAELGEPIGGEPLPRCATVRGEDAVTLGATFEGANQLTRWVDAGADPAGALTINVRPLLPGDGDVCAVLLGATG